MKTLDVVVNNKGEIIVDLHTGNDCGEDLDRMIKDLERQGIEINVKNRTERDNDDGRGIPVKC